MLSFLYLCLCEEQSSFQITAKQTSWLTKYNSRQNWELNPNLSVFWPALKTRCCVMAASCSLPECGCNMKHGRTTPLLSIHPQPGMLTAKVELPAWWQAKKQVISALLLSNRQLAHGCRKSRQSRCSPGLLPGLIFTCKCEQQATAIMRP